jgi:pilus assembly protein CpaD
MSSTRPLPAANGRRVGMLLARVLALGGGAAMLAGCFTTTPVAGPAASDYRLRHPIAVTEGVRTVELFIGSNRGGLTAEQRADVFALAGTWRREATGGFVIELPTATKNEIAAANALHEARAILSAAGVPPHAIEVRPYRSVDPRKLATLKLNYSTMVADAGPCGTWPDDLGPTYARQHNDNVQFFNFGCATQRNLAAMVDNKADLVQPRGEVPPYTGRRTTVLDKYHRGEPTQTVDPDKSKGKISEVGNKQ